MEYKFSDISAIPCRESCTLKNYCLMHVRTTVCPDLISGYKCVMLYMYPNNNALNLFGCCCMRQTKKNILQLFSCCMMSQASSLSSFLFKVTFLEREREREEGREEGRRKGGREEGRTSVSEINSRRSYEMKTSTKNCHLLLHHSLKVCLQYSVLSLDNQVGMVTV